MGQFLKMLKGTVKALTALLDLVIAVFVITLCAALAFLVFLGVHLIRFLTSILSDEEKDKR